MLNTENEVNKGLRMGVYNPGIMGRCGCANGTLPLLPDTPCIGHRKQRYQYSLMLPNYHHSLITPIIINISASAATCTPSPSPPSDSCGRACLLSHRSATPCCTTSSATLRPPAAIASPTSSPPVPASIASSTRSVQNSGSVALHSQSRTGRQSSPESTIVPPSWRALPSYKSQTIPAVSPSFRRG